jgi:hypothetical protein
LVSSSYLKPSLSSKHQECLNIIERPSNDH